MKSFGAGIVCSVCSAQPYPDDPDDDPRDLRPSARRRPPGLCERCRPAKEKRAPRPVAASPLEAVSRI